MNHYKLLNLKNQMVFGVLLVQEAGKDVIMSMKSLYTIIAPWRLRNALLPIHILEGMLISLVKKKVVDIKVLSVYRKKCI